MVRSLAVAAAVAAAACHPHPVAPRLAPGTCAPLPATPRIGLRAGPDGRTLYWLERQRVRGYGDAWPTWSVVRWHPGDAAPEVLAPGADTVFRVRGDGTVVAARGDEGVYVWGPVHEAVSWSGELDALELVGDDTAAFLRGGLWFQPLYRVAPTYGGPADRLVGADATSAVIVDDDRLWRVAAATGARTPLALPAADVVRVFGDVGVYATDAEVAVVGADGKRTTVLAGAGLDYRITATHIIATQRDDDVARVVLIDGAGAHPLPEVRGAAAVVGAAQLADGETYVLAVHDVDRDGAVSTDDETDLCRLGTQPLALAHRTVPQRFVAAQPALEALMKTAGATRWYLDREDALPRLELELPSRPADHAAMWATLATVAGPARAALGEPTLDVAITFGDGRRALSQYTPGLRRSLAWAGVGAAMVVDPRDRDAVLTAAVRRADDGQVVCAGTVENTTDHPLVDLVARCKLGDVSDTTPVIPARLPPGGRGAFTAAMTFDADGLPDVTLEAGPGNDDVSTLDTAAVARRQRVVDAAEDLLRDTQVTIADWQAGDGDGPVVVTVVAPAGFAHWSGVSSTNLADLAYRRLVALGPEDLDGRPGQAIVLDLQDDDRTWRFDGKTLVDATP